VSGGERHTHRAQDVAGLQRAGSAGRAAAGANAVFIQHQQYRFALDVLEADIGRIGQAILLMLDKYGICASSGSACTSGSLEPSHVLRAMGVPFTAAHGSIRFSLSRYNTEEEVDYTIEKLPPIINRLRELSPFVTK